MLQLLVRPVRPLGLVCFVMGRVSLGLELGFGAIEVLSNVFFWIFNIHSSPRNAGERWPSGLELGRTVEGSNPTSENFSVRNFGNSVYPALPVSFGGG